MFPTEFYVIVMFIQVRACAEEPHIYHTVFTLLENLVLESAGSWTLICVTHTLHTGVRQSINKDYTVSITSSSNVLNCVKVRLLER